jgi:hypothetical protein
VVRMAPVSHRHTRSSAPSDAALWGYRTGPRIISSTLSATGETAGRAFDGPPGSCDFVIGAEPAAAAGFLIR